MTTKTKTIKLTEPRFELVAASMSLDEISTSIQDIAGPAGIDPRMLPTVTVPPGGGINWELPDGEPARVIEGVLLHWKTSRVRYEKPYGSGGEEPPDCYSNDGIKGFGNPGGDCFKCPFAAWGSHPDPDRPSAKGCSEYRILYVLRSGFLLPLTIKIPGSSLAAFTRFALTMLDYGGAKFGHVVRIGLDKEKSKSGFTYSQVTFERGDELPVKEKEAVRSYADQLVPFLDRAPNGENQA